MVSNPRTTVPTVIYTAAHGGFDLSRVPLGGAAAICAALTEAWREQKPFPMELLTPAILGREAPQDKDLVRYSETRYARFCFDFQRATTAEILRHDPRSTAVLINDVSEGPDFRLLAAKGYPLYTIYHVNVVDYFAALYLRGWIKTETVAKAYARAERWGLTRAFPKIVGLIFAKQQDSLTYSRGVIVPSEGMKRVLLASYPGTSPDKIHVIPWGVRTEPIDETAVARRRDELRRHYGIPAAARVLLTLSRISPEKGQDRLLQALALWEREGNLPAEGLVVFLCGEAAYMQGKRFQLKLERLARTLKKVHVIFPGYLAGVEKQAHFRLAELYVFPSRHEGYGLTLLEACRAGLPVVACDHYGAEGLVQSDFGERIPAASEAEIPTLLKSTLQRLLADPARLQDMGKNAKRFAETRTFAQTAQHVAEIILR